MFTAFCKYFCCRIKILPEIVPEKVKKKVTFDSKNVFHSAPNLSSLFVGSQKRVHHSYSYESFLNETVEKDLDQVSTDLAPGIQKSEPESLSLDVFSEELAGSIT